MTSTVPFMLPGMSLLSSENNNSRVRVRETQHSEMVGGHPARKPANLAESGRVEELHTDEIRTV